MTEPHITVSDAAKQAGVLTGYVRELLGSGRLEGVKVEGKWQIDRKAFDSWLSKLETRRQLRRVTA